MKTLFVSAVLALSVAFPISANLQPAKSAAKDIEPIDMQYENSVDHALSLSLSLYTKEHLRQELNALSADIYHRVRQQNKELIKAFKAAHADLSDGLPQTASQSLSSNIVGTPKKPELDDEAKSSSSK
ncbi:MAG: hypothetical protein LPD71_06240 [Shewanella sp.]|nr:hypothetical protein [Shewanella sp.]MCF1429854.1 hypothetical protein [Shewanella sp.]MCF1438345.1 hypothetical protein [Shewanella sp.]MCF1458184.1 hypothetical protein [Shewanella sp.]